MFTHHRLAGVLAGLAGATFALSVAAQTLTPAPGCGPEAATDPKPLEHKAARCAPNSPPPVPLAAKTTIRMATLPTIENFAPFAIGLAKGEFLKENIELEVVNVPVSDAIQLMANEKLDAIYSAPTAGFYNAINL